MMMNGNGAGNEGPAEPGGTVDGRRDPMVSSLTMTLLGIGDPVEILGDEDTLDLRFDEPLEDVLRAAGRDAGDTWLCCCYCERFFQARHLRRDFLGNRQGCAFCSCAGFNVAIHLWNAFGGDGWPTEAELYHGKMMP